MQNPSPHDESPADRAESRQRRRHHRGQRGHGPWGGRGPWGPPRGPRRERGDVRAAILLLLAEQPRHGYELITEISDRSEGRWQPSPGSIYPVLKRLARDGLVRPEHENGKRIFALTDVGRALVDAESATWGQPWDRPADAAAEAGDELWSQFRQLAMALTQVTQLDDPTHVASATQTVVDARKAVYRLLAE